jgi:hypothetical protein
LKDLIHSVKSFGSIVREPVDIPFLHLGFLQTTLIAIAVSIDSDWPGHGGNLGNRIDRLESVDTDD